MMDIKQSSGDDLLSEGNLSESAFVLGREPFNAERLTKTSCSKHMREKPINTPIINLVY
jgi:hypothetical protein